MQPSLILSLLAVGAGAIARLLSSHACLRFRADPQPTRAWAVFQWSVIANLGVLLLLGGAVAVSYGIRDSAQATFGNITPDWIVTIVVWLAPVLAALLFMNRTDRLASIIFEKPDARPVPPHKNYGAHTSWFAAYESGWFLNGWTYKIFLTDSMLSGARVRGTIVEPESRDEAEHNQAYWVRTMAETLYERLDVTSAEFLLLHTRNFQLRWRDIDEIEYAPDKRWGQPDVIHSGRLILHLRTKRKREFLLLGDHDGERLRAELDAAMRRSRTPSDTLRHTSS